MNRGASFKSIRYKLVSIMLLSTLVGLLVAGGVLAWFDHRTYREQWINDLATQTELLGATAVAALSFDDADAAAQSLSVLKYRKRIRSAAIYTARGGLFATYARAGETPQFPELPGEDGVKVEGNDLVAFKRIVENGEILGTAYVQAESEFTKRLFDYARIVGIVTIVALLLSGLLAFWLQAIITRPILSVAGVARRIVETRDYSSRAVKTGDDEVANLADSFNGMLEVIEERARALESINTNLGREITERQRVEQEMLQLNAELERRVRERTSQLELTNQELESFCYSVSHDLRGPLRAIDGFSQALREELPQELPADAQRYFERIRAGTLRMGQLIEDLLNLSRVSRGDLQHKPVDLSTIANEIVKDLRTREPGRKVDVSVWDGMQVNGDGRLLRAGLENLLGNAWKFTSKAEHARIEVGTMRDGDRSVYFVRDNGAGFDMAFADKLFGAFQRLHSANEFAGTGIGLATVQRIVHRHGGRIWADAQPGKGAVFYFTLVPDAVPATKWTN